MLYLEAARWPVYKRHVEEAKKYHDLAINDTVVYDGWDRKNQSKRLMIGYTAEVWLADYLRRKTRQFVHHPLPSGSQGDEYDLDVGGKLIDVKTTWTFDIPPRVNKNRTISTHVDWYAFTRMDSNLQWIQLLGVATREEVTRPDNLIRQNELIPGTDKPEFFRNGSYYMSRLRPIWAMVKELRNGV